MARRQNLGVELANAQTAVAEFVRLITSPGADGKGVRARLFSAGLSSDLIYGLKNKRQKELGAAKLITALVSCTDLAVIVEGKRELGAPPNKWIVQARLLVDDPAPADSEGERISPQATQMQPTKRKPEARLGSDAPVQLTLFGSVQVTPAAEVEIQEFTVIKKEPTRADIRIGVLLRTRSRQVS